MVRQSRWFVVGVALLGFAASACGGGGGGPTARVHVVSLNNPDTGDATLWLGGPAAATTEYELTADNGGADPYADVHVEVYVDQDGQSELEDRYEVPCAVAGLLPSGGVCSFDADVYVLEDHVTFLQGHASLRFVLVQGTSDVLHETSVPVLLEAYYN